MLGCPKWTLETTGTRHARLPKMDWWQKTHVALDVHVGVARLDGQAYRSTTPKNRLPGIRSARTSYCIFARPILRARSYVRVMCPPAHTAETTMRRTTMDWVKHCCRRIW